MSLTLGLAGMDPATEAALKAAFSEANARFSGRWELLPETQADHIVVDMDSMYGPMSWLRLHASGKCVIGLTSAARAQTDFRLARPFSTESLAELLQELAGDTVQATSPVPTVDTPAQVAAVSAPADAPALPANAAPEPAAAAAPAIPAVAGSPPEDPAVNLPAAPPVAMPLSDPPVVKASAPDTLFDWLSGGRLRGRLRYRRFSGPTLLIDAETRQYHGPSALKPLAQYFDGEVVLADFDTLDQADWDHEIAIAGAAQPLARLVWLGGLCAGKGQLLPGLDGDAKFQLNRWPQIEREFPRHFRIATAMMKGPSVLAEVAEASGIALEEIIDFVNASLATGVAELVAELPVQAAQPPKSGGLLGRLRGR